MDTPFWWFATCDFRQNRRNRYLLRKSRDVLGTPNFGSPSRHEALHRPSGSTDGPSERA